MSATRRPPRARAARSRIAMGLAVAAGAWLLLAGVLAVPVQGGSITAPGPNGVPVQGGPVANVYTSLADGTTVNRPSYASPSDVYLTGAPCVADGSQLPAGDYVFAVAGATNGMILSDDSIDARQFTINEAGRITAASPARVTGSLGCANGARGLTLALMPFELPVGQEEFAVTVATASSVAACIAAGDADGFCTTVDSASTTFRLDSAVAAPASPTGTPGGTSATGPMPGDGQSTGAGALPSASGGSAPGASADSSGSPESGASPSPSEDAGSGQSAGNQPPSPGSSPPPASTPAASSRPGPTPSPPPRSTPTPAQPPAPPAGSGSGPNSGTWRTPPPQPTPAPFKLPPGAYYCPGLVITPTGCQPINAPVRVPVSQGQPPATPGPVSGGPVIGGPVVTLPGATPPASAIPSPGGSGSPVGPSASAAASAAPASASPSVDPLADPTATGLPPANGGPQAGIAVGASPTSPPAAAGQGQPSSTAAPGSSAAPSRTVERTADDRILGWLAIALLAVVAVGGAWIISRIVVARRQAGR